jgi:hypothetical protein
VAFKPNQNIDRVLKKLCRRRPLDHLITKRHLGYLKKAAEVDRATVDLFLYRLQVLDYLALTPNKISFPAIFKQPKKLKELSQVGIGYLADLMGRARELYLGNAGFARKLDLKIERPSLTKEVDDIAMKKKSIANIGRPKNELAGNSLLFRALIAARAELYHLEKSGLDKAGFVREFSRLLEEFPFNEDKLSYRRQWMEDMTMARDHLIRGSGSSADVTLVPLLVRILGKLNEQERGRINRLKSQEEDTHIPAPLSKLSIVDKRYAKCVLRTHAYKKLPDGSWELVPKEEVIPLYLAPSKFDRMLSKAEGEEEKNAGTIAQLRDLIHKDPLAWWHKLYLHQKGLSGAKDPGKKKAQAGLWGAAHLALIPKEQDRRLVLALIDSAIEGLERRNEILRLKIENLPEFKARAEAMMAELLKDLAHSEAQYFMKWSPNLRDIDTLSEICDRMKSYFGTLLAPESKQQREEWVGQARSHVMGVLAPMKKLLELRQEIAKLSKERWDPGAPWNKTGSHSAAAELKKRGLDKLIEDKEDEFNEQAKDAAAKAAREMLEIGFDVENRDQEWEKGQRTSALYGFFKEKARTYGAEIVPPEEIPVKGQLEMDL